MENHASLIVNSAFIFGCATMAAVFLALPLPSNKGLRKYRISLRLLAGAYLAMAIIKTATMVFNPVPIDLLSMNRLTISSLQASLFTIALITLLSPRFITRQKFYLQIIPVAAFNLIYLTVASLWGNPIVQSYRELSEMAFNQSMLIREFFFLLLIVQLGYLTYLFTTQDRIYEIKIDNYFADNYRLHLAWVRYCFYAALFIGISAILSGFIVNETVLMALTAIYAIFYVVFGICYIQYPYTYAYIEQAINSMGNIPEEPTRNNRRLAWNELKNSILIEKYYLKPEVNIEDMARYLKIGRTTLSKCINTEEGQNFNAWINLLRIEEAKLLLEKYPEYTLIEISELVGYSESSNFSRQFKRITSKSPSVWRKSLKS